ncbi:acyl-coenzyme A thioesterase 13-like [Ctenocephalides felis]|uniref:acyl-coenzyme A thioesterase 13-like n=1 Tax=Ctenocephalides felis TaxID=7515 RepID=UPI000E6E4265|nr:acyl-coenzyme A thioesterase 13-like [Ctenocephalides felis]XP_026482303.1 acyl-coenzyme A thioesterase 13-like [Ctenocephalides felis]
MPGALRSVKTLAEYFKLAKGFDQCLNKLTLISAEKEGKCVVEFTVDKEHVNAAGNLHGGFTATLVDVVSTFALVAAEKPPGVSVDIHVSYLKGATLGEQIVVEANTRKAGRTLAFLDVELFKKECREIIARGSHTKFIGS